MNRSKTLIILKLIFNYFFWLPLHVYRTYCRAHVYFAKFDETFFFHFSNCTEMKSSPNQLNSLRIKESS